MASAIIIITNIVITGSIIKIVIEIETDTIISVNIRKTVIKREYVTGTSD